MWITLFCFKRVKVLSLTYQIKNKYMTHEERDQLIDEITTNVIAMVPGSENYDIMTACMINGEFVLVTGYPLEEEYEVEKQMLVDLEKAARTFENIQTI